MVIKYLKPRKVEIMINIRKRKYMAQKCIWKKMRKMLNAMRIQHWKYLPPFSVKIHPDTEDETTATITTGGSSTDDGQPTFITTEPSPCTTNGQQTSCTGSTGKPRRSWTSSTSNPTTEKTTGNCW